MAPRSRSRSKKSSRSSPSMSSMSSSPRSPDTRSVMPGAQIISSLITIAINAYLLNYITNLEKKNCECSEHWQRHYIKYFSMVAIILSVLMIITTLTGAVVKGPLAGLLFAVRAAFLIASVVNTFVHFHYSTGLENKGCECSEDTARTFMTYYSGVMIFIIVVVLLYGILAGAVNAARS